MTYAELIAKLQLWWESDETAFVAEVDTFIEHAELRIYRTVDLNVAHTTDISVALTQGQRSVTIPTAVIVIRNVALLDSGGTTNVQLLQKDRTFIRDYAPDNSVEGTPRYYAWDTDTKDGGGTIWIAPTPDATIAAGTLTVDYTYRPSQLASGNTTTWLSLNAPDVLFYACMLEVLTFQKAEPDTIADYTAKYQQTLQGFIMEENLRNRGDEYRSGEIKVGGQ